MKIFFYEIWEISVPSLTAAQLPILMLQKVYKEIVKLIHMNQAVKLDRLNLDFYSHKNIDQQT